MVQGWTTQKRGGLHHFKAAVSWRAYTMTYQGSGITLYCSISQDVRVSHYSSMLLHSEKNNKIGKCDLRRNGSLSVSHTSKPSSSTFYVAVSFCYPWSYRHTSNAYSSVTKEFVVCSHVLLVSICYSHSIAVVCCQMMPQ